MQRYFDRLTRNANVPVTLASAAVLLTVLVVGAVMTSAMSSALSTLRDVLAPLLNWYLPALVATITFVVLWLGLGRYRNVRLGGDEESPEFSTTSWLAMLFAAGTGVGLLFWSVAEPLLHFQSNPFIEPDSPDWRSSVVAVRLTFFHWGLNGWAVFGLVGLVLAYFSFRRKLPLSARAALYPVLGERIRGWPGHLMDIFAVIATAFGIATTIGLGVQQMNTGLDWLLGVGTSKTMQVASIVVVVGIAVVSVVSGLNRGIRKLSELNVLLSFALLLVFLVVGPTFDLMALLVQSTGNYLEHLISTSFWSGYGRQSEWQSQWTTFFWGWWVAWSPFVGMFIARISRGRTLREYVFGVLLVPTLISLVWIAFLGGTALHLQAAGEVDLVAAVQQDVAVALYRTIGALSMPQFLVMGSGFLAIVLIAFYIITSAASGTLVLGTLTTAGDIDPSKAQRIGWGVGIGALTAVLLIAGGIQALQDAVVAASLPFSLVLIAMVFGLLQALQQERYAPRRGRKKQEKSPLSGHR